MIASGIVQLIQVFCHGVQAFVPPTGRHGHHGSDHPLVLLLVQVTDPGCQPAEGMLPLNFGVKRGRGIENQTALLIVQKGQDATHT
ncbi:MAG TPA: hypothetical protein VFP68_14100 [Burkholderiaceae bacterium]|nr:hypothetical protein [Burkholderiaceae bacterium]